MPLFPFYAVNAGLGGPVALPETRFTVGEQLFSHKPGNNLSKPGKSPMVEVGVLITVPNRVEPDVAQFVKNEQESLKTQ